MALDQQYHPDDSLDIWWVVPGVLGGKSMPFIHPERHEARGAPLDAFPDELPALWNAGVRGIVCLLNMPSVEATYTDAGFVFHLMALHDGAAPSLDQFREFLGFVEGAHDRPCGRGPLRSGNWPHRNDLGRFPRGFWFHSRSRRCPRTIISIGSC